MTLKNTTNFNFLKKIRQKISDFEVKVHLSANSVSVLNYFNIKCLDKIFNSKYCESIYKDG